MMHGGASSFRLRRAPDDSTQSKPYESMVCTAVRGGDYAALEARLAHQAIDQQIDRRGCEQRQGHCDQRFGAVRTRKRFHMRNIRRFYAESPADNLLEDSEFVYDSGSSRR